MTAEEQSHPSAGMAVNSLIQDLESQLTPGLTEEAKNHFNNFMDNLRLLLETAFMEFENRQAGLETSIGDFFSSRQIELAKLNQEITQIQQNLGIALAQKHELVEGRDDIIQEKTEAERRAELALLVADEAEKKLREVIHVNTHLNAKLQESDSQLNEAILLAEKFHREKQQLENRLADLLKNNNGI
ncbi:MAG: hypothetical protein HQK55_03060 [Deltaproteobacteria bacterium]|nr:hypothetical protein [Deltaproteobacteria bacterium]